jgi:alcohol dehydrogenase class IV
VHGLAAPLGGLLSAPHAAICARLLPHVVAANVRALHERGAASPVLERYAEIARILTGRSDASIPDGIAWIQSLCADLKIPPLSRHGLTTAAIPQLVAEAQRASSTKGNPIELTDQELTGILEQAL